MYDPVPPAVYQSLTAEITAVARKFEGTVVTFDQLVISNDI